MRSTRRTTRMMPRTTPGSSIATSSPPTCWSAAAVRHGPGRSLPAHACSWGARSPPRARRRKPDLGDLARGDAVLQRTVDVERQLDRMVPCDRRGDGHHTAVARGQTGSLSDIARQPALSELLERGRRCRTSIADTASSRLRCVGMRASPGSQHYARTLAVEEYNAEADGPATDPRGRL